MLDTRSRRRRRCPPGRSFHPEGTNIMWSGSGCCKTAGTTDTRCCQRGSRPVPPNSRRRFKKRLT